MEIRELAGSLASISRHLCILRQGLSLGLESLIHHQALGTHLCLPSQHPATQFFTQSMGLQTQVLMIA